MEKVKILVVEDEAISREIFKNCLEETYEILMAENGDVALETLKKENYKIAIILLDLRMPVMNGIRFLEKREQNEELKKIPVIVITAFDEIENEVKALEAGADDVLSKPFDRRVLLKRVSNLIEIFKVRMQEKEDKCFHSMDVMETINKKFMNVIDYITEGALIFKLGKQPSHVFINESLCKLLGYTRIEYEELVKDNIHALVHKDDCEELNKKIKNAIKEDGKLEFTYRLRKSNKKYQWVSLKASIINNSQGEEVFYGIVFDVDQLKKQFEKDELTGLCNKDSFEKIVDIFFKGNLEEAKNSRMAALFTIDLDNFKSINDHFGHVYGDYVLVEIGKKIHSIFRDEDVIAHLGGDEFSVFLTHKIPEEIIDLRARQICEAIKTEYRVAGEVVSTSCSVGVAIAPQHGNSYKQLYKNADKAQYLAKKSGKNKHIIFDDMSE